jgi:thiol-disulfide isomerase/thioredoxin
MKDLISFFVGLTLSGYATADFEKWTNKDGKSVELDLVKVTQVGEQAQGEFKMRDGRAATLKASDLVEEDAKRLAEWKPKGAAAIVSASAFDEALQGNLIILKGKRLASLKDFVKPTKYYLFYYTASWCGPCHRFTPSLVDFYNKFKPGNKEFEVVLITCDDSDDAMDKYAAELKMPWPQLKLAKVDHFKKEFKHPGGGIPNLVLTDTQGKILKLSYEDGKYIGPAAVMAHLDPLLTK